MTQKSFQSKRLLQYFLQGLLVLAPVSITLYLIYQIFHWLDQLVPIYINLSGNPDKPFYLPGIGFLLVLAGIIAVGYISSFFVVGRILSVFDHWLERTPGVKIIYSFVKDFSEAFAGKKRKFQKTVLVSIYQPDVFQIGFITNEDLVHFGLQEHITVYVPNSYGVMGTLFMVKPERIKLLPEVSAPEALKFAISGGVVEVED
ncbi:MAG TPA: DUF502 domain-containing protein [Phnomibacter sp.]|nr:DUF502 domain-containing protein [Phnomibacter sp.]